MKNLNMLGALAIVGVTVLAIVISQAGTALADDSIRLASLSNAGSRGPASQGSSRGLDPVEQSLLYMQEIANLSSIPVEMIVAQSRTQVERLFQGQLIDEKIHSSLHTVCTASLPFHSPELAAVLTDLVGERYGKLLHTTCAAKGGCFRAQWSADFTLFQACARAAQKHIHAAPLAHEQKAAAKRELLRALVSGHAFSFDKEERRQLASQLIHPLVHELYPEIPFRYDAQRVKGELAQLIDGTAEAGYVDKLEGRVEFAELLLKKLRLK